MSNTVNESDGWVGTADGPIRHRRDEAIYSGAPYLTPTHGGFIRVDDAGSWSFHPSPGSFREALEEARR